MCDLEYMKMAIELAKKGEGSTNPNPLVGAIIVKNSKVIGKGYHEKYGQAHAERNAIADCKEQAEGATMYVTLEPCCHYGKTPPCTDAIINSKIAKVVVGTLDKNKLVAGQGVEILRNAGIEVNVGILEEECIELNKIFFHYTLNREPFIAMKYAMTLDGKIASYSGKSKWITGEVARRHVHELRNKYMAIMVGIGTVLKDNPRLDCRLDNSRNPIRIICDTNLRIPLDCFIARTASEIETYIATAEDLYIDEKISKGNLKDKLAFMQTRKDKEEKLKALGLKFIKLPTKNNSIDLVELKANLGMMGIDSVLLEGGATINYQALDSGVVDYLYAYIAPKILGGIDAVTAVEGIGKENPNTAFEFITKKIINLEGDTLIEYEVKRESDRLEKR